MSAQFLISKHDVRHFIYPLGVRLPLITIAGTYMVTIVDLVTREIDTRITYSFCFIIFQFIV